MTLMIRLIKIGIGIGLLLLILLGASLLNYYNEQKLIIKEKDPGLTREDLAIYEQRMADGLKRLSEATTDEEKYELYLYLGQQKYGLGKYAEAKDYYKNAEQYNPNREYGVYTLLYQVELDMRDNQAAKKSILTALELGHKVADNWLKYIILEKDRLGADNDRLIQIYQDAFSATAGTVGEINIVTSYAQFLESIGQLDKSIQNWEKATVLYPERKAVYEAEIDRIQKK